MKSRGAQGEPAPLARARERLQAGRPDAAEPILREWLAGRPDHARGRHLFGLALVQSGRADAGFAALRRSVELDPAEPMFRRNLGVMLAEHGALDEARGVLEGLVERWPKDALGHDALGTAHQRAGRYAAAIACHERSLALAPAADGAWSNYAAALLGAGRLAEATRSARHALTLNPRNALAALNLGNALRDAGESAAAAAAYRSAVSHAPSLAIAWHNLGMVLREAGDGRAAVDCFAAAMRAAPLQPAHAAGFVDAVAAAGWEVLPDALVPAALQCLEHEEVDAHGLATVLFNSLAADPRVGPALARAGEALSADDLIALCDARLLRLLERTTVPGVPAEIAFARLRRACLNHVTGDARPPLPLALACALAQQAFLGEYAWPMGAGEAERAATMACADDALRVSLQAAYRPIGALGPPIPKPDATLPDAFHRMWRDQVEAVRQERDLQRELRALTPIRAGVSAAVRAQYEANPYPRWRVAPALAGALPLPQKLRALFPWLDAHDALPESPRVLVAGCGTGLHPIATGRLHPTARVLAVDISGASLAYALRRARELGVENVEFAQADLLELGGLVERFDLIECAGVLHHLEDPLEGWRVLVRLLAPAGLMKVALYSARARSGVVAAREFIAASGFPADPEGLRAGRAAILALPPGAPARDVIGSPDFWSLSGCRDLMFHVQEHRFTLPQIGAALEVLGLEFLGFEFPDRVAVERYRRETKGDPLGRSLSDWDNFEARYPDTFAGMYQFWVRAR